MHQATLPRLFLDEAQHLQFRVVDAIRSTFSGEAWLTRGELGVGRSGVGSLYTRRAETALARMFGAEDAVLVWGAGTGAIRVALGAVAPAGSPILIHHAPVYPTTQATFRLAGYSPIAVDVHSPETLTKALMDAEYSVLYLQHTRQQLSDHYNLAEVIAQARAVRPDLPVVVDDNYAVANTPRIGVELGADLSAFSAFKLLGPEGVGVVVGRARYIASIRADMYSGGTRVPGHQAQDVLIGLSQAFVFNAISQETAHVVANAVNGGSFDGIETAFVANLQSPVVLIRLQHPWAEETIRAAGDLGALPFPVGAMSRYELPPLFYRVSSTMIASLGDAEARHWLRIGPMRAGPDTILSILRESLRKAAACS